MSPHSSGHLGEECPVVWVEGAAGATALIALIRNELKIILKQICLNFIISLNINGVQIY